ncbi:hypothetical protein [Pleionea sp. CnH1-48]|uniref:hypothetical protein n=1 Tax=Pleionea sp. CnH1-48 TaxID=2954494 RepID=UPI0020985E2D|nr:hypothetical protein [Pleionea sp. CnH1-48]MCO7226400.1 hypothetical protein [Pleionea sp. CnH1-48]
MNKLGYIAFVLVVFVAGIYLGQQGRGVEPVTPTSDSENTNTKHTLPLNAEATTKDVVDEPTVEHRSQTSIEKTVKTNKAKVPSKLPEKASHSERYATQSIDFDWSHSQREKIVQLFDSHTAQEAGILLQSSECKSSMCRLELSNYDSEQNALDIQLTMETLYSVDWSEANVFHIEAVADDPNTRVIYLIDTERNP